ncbi:AAA domain-containing protein [Paenibacillus sp. MER 99-2]|uniref:AAA domain-containing protein n=1 Tax=Paenibacillus sp. MER 99-2 TaxID=2939572 RepID=UPI00203E306E|nr:AAA domain-containing protein [Paenibacillus sp. MER 99-2]MCM3170765.1 AAA domain-containing protein [Paenibacillus sp. MER 99-2]
MLIKQLLHYYLDCIKLESYYSVQLKDEDLVHSQVYPNDPEGIAKHYEKLSTNLTSKETILFGYPLLRTIQGNKPIYIPLCLWSNPSFLSNRDLFKADYVGFHQEIFKSFTDKKSKESLHELQEQFAISPRTFLSNQQNFEKLINLSEYNSQNIISNHVILLANNTTGTNYLISKEIEDILTDKNQPSSVLSSFLTHSYSLSASEPQRTQLHIVPSNYPQNVALADLQQTISIIKGPPGTGKTQTIVNLLANQVDQLETCMVASTNNQAVDNISEKLISKGISNSFFGFVRLGSKNHNKKQTLEIKTAIERMKQEISGLLSDETYNYYLHKSKLLMDQINQLELQEQKIVDLKSSIKQLKDLIDILNNRLRLNHLTTMKYSFEALDIPHKHMENRLREIVDEPLHLYGNDVFRKFRAYIASKLKFYMRRRIQKYLHSIAASQLWEYVDTTMPTNSLAQCEEIIKVINLEQRLKQYQDQLLQVQKQQIEQSVNIDKLYQKKNVIDLAIVRTKWLRKAEPILRNPKEMHNIIELINELNQKGEIKRTSFAFPSFLKLFPVLLVSSLSARRCIPSGSSIDLAIIDESSQCSIASVFSLLQVSRRACFLGDIQQLNHIVTLQSEHSKSLFDIHAKGIDYSPYCFHNVSAFQRAVHACEQNEHGQHLLNYHYRCIPSIVSFSNQHFYRNRLFTMRQEPDRKPYHRGIFSTNVFGRASGTSNDYELKEIKSIVEKLEHNGINDIGIVTPFGAQKRKLIQLFKRNPNIKVGTVHTFQGGECQAIIFSAVISSGSTAFQINFVQNSYRLINVALTRALDYFILVGNLAEIDNSSGYLTKLSKYIYTIEASSFHRPAIMLSIKFNQLIRQESRKTLMHVGERMIYNKLLILLEGMPFIVFPKVPIKDVLSIQIGLDNELKSYYFTSHMDFVIYEKESLQPLCSIEYDGFYHRRNAKTIDNDLKKDKLCGYADFQQFRIASNDEDDGWNKLKTYLHSFN